MSTGIYKITIGNHIYIGSAAHKKGFRARWSAHINRMKANNHHSPIVQNCYNKYKYAKFEIIELCEHTICIEREQYYLDLLKPDMNICKTAGSILGMSHSIETKEKISKANTGRVVSKETRENMSKSQKGKVKSKEATEKACVKRRKPICQYDKDMNLIKEWLSAKDVERELDIDNTSINKCLKDKRKTAGGFIWKYKMKEDKMVYII